MYEINYQFTKWKMTVIYWLYVWLGKMLHLTNSLGPKTSLNASVISRVIMFPMAFVIKEIAIITAFIDSGACNKKWDILTISKSWDSRIREHGILNLLFLMGCNFLRNWLTWENANFKLVIENRISPAVIIMICGSCQKVLIIFGVVISWMNIGSCGK